MNIESQKSKTQTEIAYNHLKSKIQTCEYIPGQEIFEKQIYADLELGRTPVREALVSLQKENLIEIFPRKGMIVKPISIQDVDELYQIRKIIEPAILSDYCSMYPKAKLMEFEQQFLIEDSNNDSGIEADINFYKMDISFHSFLISITNNSLLINIYKGLMEKQYRLAVFGAKIKSSHRKSNFDQHQAIISSLLNEDQGLIRETTLTHINHSLIESLKAIQS